MLGIYRVQGDSMVPVLSDGDFVLTRKLFRAPKVGMVVVVRHPELGVIVKRVSAKEPERGLMLAGENARSTSSEEIGWVPSKLVLGAVFWMVRRSATTS